MLKHKRLINKNSPPAIAQRKMQRVPHNFKGKGNEEVCEN
jgi:hypothetical protein